jgi:hypothetical protein
MPPGRRQRNGYRQAAHTPIRGPGSTAGRPRWAGASLPGRQNTRPTRKARHRSPNRRSSHTHKPFGCSWALPQRPAEPTGPGQVEQHDNTGTATSSSHIHSPPEERDSRGHSPRAGVAQTDRPLSSAPTERAAAAPTERMPVHEDVGWRPRPAGADPAPEHGGPTRSSPTLKGGAPPPRRVVPKYQTTRMVILSQDYY